MKTLYIAPVPSIAVIPAAQTIWHWLRDGISADLEIKGIQVFRDDTYRIINHPDEWIIAPEVFDFDVVPVLARRLIRKKYMHMSANAAAVWAPGGFESCITENATVFGLALNGCGSIIHQIGKYPHVRGGDAHAPIPMVQRMRECANLNCLAAGVDNRYDTNIHSIIRAVWTMANTDFMENNERYQRQIIESSLVFKRSLADMKIENLQERQK